MRKRQNVKEKILKTSTNENIKGKEKGNNNGKKFNTLHVNMYINN